MSVRSRGRVNNPRGINQHTGRTVKAGMKSGNRARMGPNTRTKVNHRSGTVTSTASVPDKNVIIANMLARYKRAS